jgi:plastocyanin
VDPLATPATANPTAAAPAGQTAQPTMPATAPPQAPPATTIASPTPSPTPAPPPSEPLKVLSGWGEGPLSINQFFGDPALSPAGNRVRVVTGSTVTWVHGSDQAHTVTFLADGPPPSTFMLQPEDPDRPPMYNPDLAVPTVPSGPWDGTTLVHTELQRIGQEFSLTFSRTGTYAYRSLFHLPMSGVIEVVPSGSPGVTRQAAIDDYVVNEIPLYEGRFNDVVATRSTSGRSNGPRGTSLWYVLAGTASRIGNLDVLRFLPDDLTVEQGDTVVWIVDHVQAHTVTFFDTQGEAPQDFIVLQLPDGRTVSPPAVGEEPSPELAEALADPTTHPRLVLGPSAQRSGTAAHDGRSLFSSGLIGEHPLIDLPMDKAWSLTFVTPGTFDYQCLLHPGMAGSITVNPR